jgi:hypothetical protein
MATNNQTIFVRPMPTYKENDVVLVDVYDCIYGQIKAPAIISYYDSDHKAWYVYITIEKDNNNMHLWPLLAEDIKGLLIVADA